MVYVISVAKAAYCNLQLHGFSVFFSLAEFIDHPPKLPPRLVDQAVHATAYVK